MTKFITDNEITDIIQQVVDKFLIPRFNVLGMNATGKWLSSLEVDAKDSVGIIKGESYTEFLAKGRKPGKMPPIQPIIKWCQAKFGLDIKQATAMAWGVAKKIEAQGTTWHEKGGTDLIELLNDPTVVNFINENITIKINKSLEQELKSIL
jgi:hypothetical protein